LLFIRGHYSTEAGAIMFIVWRRRPITSDRRAELFAERLCGRRHAGDTSLDAPAWTPLHCSHTGAGRVSFIPLLMQSRRCDGRPRQELLRRLPAIRSCCLSDPFIVAAWWHAIGELDRYLTEDGDDDEGRFWARDRGAIMASLRAKVPRPGKAGVAAFTAYRLRKEAEQAERQRQCDEHWRREFERQKQERLRQAEEAAERQARAQEQVHKMWEEFERLCRGWDDRAPGRRSGTHWSEVLGVPRSATLDDVKRRWRELALLHHPDRGGDAAVFMRVKDAFDRAEAELRGAAG
jgi:hypothetical protein